VGRRVRAVRAVVRDRRVLLLHDDVRQVEKAERALRAAVAAVRQLRGRGAGRGSPRGLLPEDLQRAGRTQVRRPVPDENAVPDDPRSGTDKRDAHQGLLVVPGPRRLLGLLREPALRQPVLHGESQMEGDQEQAEPGVHVRPTEAHVRPDQGVRRRDDEERAQDPGRDRPRVGGARRLGKLLDRRDRHVRLRAAAERRGRRRFRIPQVRQDFVQAVREVAVAGALLDDLAGAVERRQVQRLPGGRRRVFPFGVPRDHSVPGRE